MIGWVLSQARRTGVAGVAALLEVPQAIAALTQLESLGPRIIPLAPLAFAANPSAALFLGGTLLLAVALGLSAQSARMAWAEPDQEAARARAPGWHLVGLQAALFRVRPLDLSVQIGMRLDDAGSLLRNRDVIATERHWRAIESALLLAPGAIEDPDRTLPLPLVRRRLDRYHRMGVQVWSDAGQPRTPRAWRALLQKVEDSLCDTRDPNASGGISHG